MTAQAPVGRRLRQGQIGNYPPWYGLRTRDWRPGLRGEGRPCEVTPRPLNEPHGAELVPSPPRAPRRLGAADSDGSSLYSFNVPKDSLALLYYKSLNGFNFLIINININIYI